MISDEAAEAAAKAWDEGAEAGAKLQHHIEQARQRGDVTPRPIFNPYRNQP